MSKLKDNDTEYYTNLVSKRSIQCKEIMRALEVVKEFIIRKNLILVGGMAIDFALRLQGDNIYTEDQIPDYDFYSPNHAADAYELGVLLCEKGFTNISCIGAIHITTMKVRVDFETVADITYCPQKIYRQVPTLMYDKLRIVHPHWQMVDQHSSLSMPFENSGREVIFHRWKKDMIRYDLLYKYYPIVPEIKSDKYTIEGGNNGSVVKKRPKSKGLAMKTVKLRMDSIKGSCISGWGAIDYTVDKEHIILTIPIGEHIDVACHNYKKFIKDTGIEIVSMYSEYIGKLPRHILCSSKFKDSDGRNKKINIYDTFGVLVSAKCISTKYDLWVCNLQWAMTYLLVKLFSSSDPKIKITAEEQYLRCRELVELGDTPSIEVYGEYNFTHSYLNSMKNTKERIYSIKADSLQPPRMYPKPTECINDKNFDPESSEYFMTDSRKLDNFIEWTLDPYPEYNSKSIKSK